MKRVRFDLWLHRGYIYQDWEGKLDVDGLLFTQAYQAALLQHAAAVSVVNSTQASA
jgi:hypothetical protein